MDKSMPMMETFSNYSMVAVYKTRGEIKFVHLKSEKFLGRFTILIFMDNKLTEFELEEWKDFSNHVKDFKKAGAYVVGVCTDSHISMRAMMTNSFPDITFPIISDRDGDFSRSFGVMKVKNGKFGAARALVILDTKGRMVHLTLHNEHTRSYPVKVMELIRHLKRDIGAEVDDSAGSLKSLSLSSAIIDEKESRSRMKENEIKKDVVREGHEEKESEKKENVAENGCSSEEKKEKSKENENNDIKSKNSKEIKDNENKQSKIAPESKGHKKPHDHNWIEAGASLSQD